MQQSVNPSRRGRRWLRLAALVAGIGVLAALGAALGHGLGAGDAQARATTATPTAASAAIVSAPPATRTAPTSAVSIPTAIPTQPPATASASPSATPAAADVLARVAAAQAALRSGQFEALIDYNAQSHSTALVSFDLGDDRQAPRFQITSVYTGTGGAQTVERIAIGERAWNRQARGWVVGPAREGIADQIRVFLPQAQPVAQVEVVHTGDTTTLRWYDQSRDADVTLVVDPASAVPRQLRAVARANGTVFVVIYRAWNVAVEIHPPAES
jgi:hypothetical protein